MAKPLLKIATSVPVILIALFWFASAGRPDKADTRIHIFNSTDRALELTVRTTTLEGEHARKQNLHLRSGQGFTFHARHADTYELVVNKGAAKSRSVKVPSMYDATKDLLVDFGGAGEFVLTPHVYVSTKLPEDQKAQIGAGLLRKHGPIVTRQPRELHVLPRRIRIGFQGAAAEYEHDRDDNRTALVYWELKPAADGLELSVR